MALSCVRLILPYLSLWIQQSSPIKLYGNNDQLFISEYCRFSAMRYNCWMKAQKVYYALTRIIALNHSLTLSVCSSTKFAIMWIKLSNLSINQKAERTFWKCSASFWKTNGTCFYFSSFLISVFPQCSALIQMLVPTSGIFSSFPFFLYAYFPFIWSHIFDWTNVFFCFQVEFVWFAGMNYLELKKVLCTAHTYVYTVHCIKWNWVATVVETIKKWKEKSFEV